MASQIHKLQFPKFISRNAFLGVLGTFSGIAIISAAIRLIIRFRHLKGVRVDDYLFLAAAIFKVAADGVLFACYAHEPMATYSGIQEAKSNKAIQKLGDQLTFAQFTDVFDWSTIFLIKLSFLFYFRILVDRLPKFQIWWWMNLGLLLPTTALMICATFIVCPHLGISIIVKCAVGPSFSNRERILVYYSVGSDIVTDLMLMSIPVLLLRKIRIDIRRKLTIGMMTCLSLFMIAIALIRAIFFNINGSTNQWFITFWTHLEASVSVMAACPIAYRNLFVLKQRKERLLRQNDNDRRRRSVLEAIWRRTRPTLPSIGVGAEMTGMSAALRGDDEGSRTESRNKDDTFAAFPADSKDSRPSSNAQRMSIQEEETAIGQAI